MKELEISVFSEVARFPDEFFGVPIIAVKTTAQFCPIIVREEIKYVDSEM
jgi:hypothetical protein